MQTTREIALVTLLMRVEEEYRLYEQGDFYDSDIDYDRTHGALKTALYGFTEQSEEVEALDLFWKALNVLEITSEVPQRPKDQKEFKELKKGTLTAVKELKSQIEHPEPLKVEAGTYEITYNITGRGGATMEILEGEEAADILEIYLLDTGMNLDDRKVIITGIKKV